MKTALYKCRSEGKLVALWKGRFVYQIFRFVYCGLVVRHCKNVKAVQIGWLFFRHKSNVISYKTFTFFICEIKNMAFYIYKLLFLYKYR